MNKRLVISCAALILSRIVPAVYASVTVEQIEEYENPPPADPVAGTVYNTAYAAVAFDGSNVETLGQYDESGMFPFQTFYAVDPSGPYSAYSNHGYYVGMFMYGVNSVAYPFVKNIYCQSAPNFLSEVVQTQDSTGVGPAPGNFAGGAKVINNSWAYDYTAGVNGYTSTADNDAINRMDYMIDSDNVTFVASCLDNSYNTGDTDDKVPWGDFNALAVSGLQPVTFRAGVGKQHADLYMPAYASFSAATTSSYATALYANATSAGQTDAMQNVVNRRLLMAGTDKTTYTPETANHLDVTYGAGEPNYDTSLAILNAGEQSLLSVSGATAGGGNFSGGSVSGSPSSQQYGWSFGTVPANGQDALLFNSSNTITSVTASLNWNVTSPVSGGNINTSDGALQFPNLVLEVRPVTSSGGGYVLGAPQTNAMLRSAATGDNVQYIFNTTSLSPGQYAFVVTGDPALPAQVGLSYVLGGTFTSQWANGAGGSWGNQSNWTTGIANGRGAAADFSVGLASPGIITLDGDRTVGDLNLGTGVTINSGTGGQLTLDDTGDSSGTVNPQIDVSAGSSTINAPINMVYGVTVTTAPGTSLSLLGGVTGNYLILKYGTGNLTLDGTIGGLGLAPLAGSTTIRPNAVLQCQGIYVNPTTTVTFAASTSSGILVRNVAEPFYVENGGILALAPAASSANRQILNASNALYLDGASGDWTGKLDLNNNDVDIFFPPLSEIFSQLQQGYNNGGWNGSGGIVSSSAAADTTHLTALGVMENDQGGQALYTAANPFDDIVPKAEDTLIKFTYYGDCNLDGKVDGSDYSLIDYAYLADQASPGSLTGWYWGDFNYDGVINGSDYTLMDNAFNLQGAALTGELGAINASVTSEIANPSAVPEPGAVALLGLASIGLLGRRPHRNLF